MARQRKWPVAVLMLPVALACVSPNSQPYVAPGADGPEPSLGDGGEADSIDARRESDSPSADIPLGSADTGAGQESGLPPSSDAPLDRPVGPGDGLPADVALDSVPPPPDGSSPLANGSACSSDGACSSKHCVDGVCCESACSGQCEACAEGGQAGKCIAVSGAPRGTRTKCLGGTGSCAGACDGMNAASCRYPGSEKECAAAKCENAMASGRSVCDGQGSCPAPSVSSCAPNQCDGTICGGGCSAAQPCSGQQYCEAGRCTPKKAAGEKCVDATSCSSGHCVDGNCCDAACDGPCQICSAAGNAGHCKSVTSADDDHCSGASTCDSQGACKKRAGGDCGGAGECATGACVDGKCCTATSCGTCQACLGGGGVCVAVTSAPDPDTCTGGRACDASGSCKKMLGQDCTGSSECSVACVDGKCCSSSSCPVCQACTGAGGSCENLTPGSSDQNPPGACAGDRSCNGVGVCQAKPGGVCQSGSDCSSGACNGGRCCSSATCTGACTSCDATGACLSGAAGVNCAVDPDNTTCQGASYCDSTGACVAKTPDGSPNKSSCGSAVACAGGAASGALCCATGKSCNFVSSLSKSACATKSDGSLWCWRNNMGLQATGITSPMAFQAQVGQSRGGCALTSSGGVWCWGINGGGQVGDGTMMDRASPVMVSGLGSGATIVDYNGSYSCAAKSDRTLWCWGYKPGGLSGFSDMQLTPKQVAVSDVVAMSATEHTCVVKGDGTVWCWGQQNAGGQLDGATRNPQSSPVQVMGAGSNNVEVRTERFWTAARKADGTVWTWGVAWADNFSTPNTVGPPVQETSFTGARKIVMSASHLCALKDDNTVWCAGINQFGETGAGMTSSGYSPAVKAGIDNVADVAASFGTSCARKFDGTVWCWGGGWGPNGSDTGTPTQIPGF